MDLTTLADSSKNTLAEILNAITHDLSPTIDTEVDEALNAVTLVVSAPQEQLGQIIGKEGKIIKSLRTILSLAFPGARINLQIKN